jgi:hypothetical protein
MPLPIYGNAPPAPDLGDPAETEPRTDPDQKVSFLPFTFGPYLAL